MKQQDHKVDQAEEAVEDLELTDQQADEAKAGKGSETLQTYLELKLAD